jgi:hypothetical protein
MLKSAQNYFYLFYVISNTRVIIVFLRILKIDFLSRESLRIKGNIKQLFTSFDAQ